MCYAQGVEGVARLPHRSEAGELTLARRRSAAGTPLNAPTLSRSLPDGSRKRRSLRRERERVLMRNARTHPTPPTGLLGVGCSGARSRCSSPSPPTLPRLRPRVMPSLRPPPRSPLKRGKAHRCAINHLSIASRAGVALRAASVAMRPPQRWNGLPTRMSARRFIGAPRRARGSRLAHRSLRDFRNGGTVCLKICMSARVIICRSRRARGSRFAQRSLCDFRRSGEEAIGCAPLRD